MNMWGFRGLKVRGNGQGCVAVRYLTPYFGYFILPPRWLVGVMPCSRKSQKELYERKDSNRKETKTFILYFPLFTGFNNHSVDEGVFPEYTEMVESSS